MITPERPVSELTREELAAVLQEALLRTVTPQLEALFKSGIAPVLTHMAALQERVNSLEERARSLQGELTLMEEAWQRIAERFGGGIVLERTN